MDEASRPAYAESSPVADVDSGHFEGHVVLYVLLLLSMVAVAQSEVCPVSS
jgi:hypothetical protein